MTQNSEGNVALLDKPAPMELQDAVKDGIVLRTNGRIKALMVELNENRIVVRGSTTSYHLKQLAIQAILDMHLGRGIEIDVQVTVIKPERTDYKEVG